MGGPTIALGGRMAPTMVLEGFLVKRGRWLGGAVVRWFVLCAEGELYSCKEQRNSDDSRKLYLTVSLGGHGAAPDARPAATNHPTAPHPTPPHPTGRWTAAPP